MLDAAQHGIEALWAVDETGKAVLDLEFDFLIELDAFDVVSTDATDTAVTVDVEVDDGALVTTSATTLAETTTQRGETVDAAVVTERTTVRGQGTTTGSVTDTGNATTTHPANTSTVTSSGGDHVVEDLTYQPEE